MKAASAGGTWQTLYYTNITAGIGGFTTTFPNGNSNVTIYNAASGPSIPCYQFSLDHRGYFIPYSTGVWTLRASNVDDAFLFWAGALAKHVWTKQNANISLAFSHNTGTPFASIQLPLTQGQYVPVRIIVSLPLTKKSHAIPRPLLTFPLSKDKQQAVPVSSSPCSIRMATRPWIQTPSRRPISSSTPATRPRRRLSHTPLERSCSMTSEIVFFFQAQVYDLVRMGDM